jgi:nucleoid-associated protein EbfC
VDLRAGGIEADAEALAVLAQAGEGSVRDSLSALDQAIACCDGQKKCLGVTIDPEAAGDAEMLQDMVMAAFNEAVRKVEEETQKKTAGMLGGMGLPPGMF